MTPTAPGPRQRDPRLDFFRGLAMFIIVIAHVPDNPWTLWIPARFGFSDATEIFVFCSGMASALAFGSIFASGRFGLGAMRIALRTWQVYWAHIGAFMVVAALMVALDRWGPAHIEHVRRLNLHRFFDDPGTNLLGLLMLRYVPNYFDILPMYLVILAMIPAVMALARVGPVLVAPVLAALWLAANLGLALPAEPWSDRVWYFNPFGWQLLFFTGFGLMAGWLPAPPFRRSLVVVAAVVLAVSIPLSYYRILGAVPELRAAASSIGFLTAKSEFGLLRYVHFLALAYLAWVAAGPAGAHLFAGPTRARLSRLVMGVGQQSLGVFIAGLVLAQLLGAPLDAYGRDPLTSLAVNMAAVAAVLAIAFVVAAFKTAPRSAAVAHSGNAAPNPSKSAPARTCPDASRAQAASAFGIAAQP